MLKKIVYPVKLTYLLFIFLVSIVSAEQGILTLTFDDGYACHHETVLPLLEKYGISGTFYVSSGLLGKTGYLTKEQVIELSQKGNEIGSHCVTHRDLKKLSWSEIENELLESKLTLEDLLQSPVVHFAPPFGSIHPQSMHLIQKYYQSSRTITRGLNTKRTNRYFFHAHTVLDRTSLMDVERWVDKAIAENKWIILVYHHIDATEGIVSMSSKAFEDHLKMIQSKNISVKTLGQAHSSL